MGWPKDPTIRRHRKRAEYLRHKPAYIARSKAYKKTVRGRKADRDWRLKKRYYVNGAAWDALFKKQRGVCALCGREPAKHTDHSHVSGAVRALLCHNCNFGLGNFRDDVRLLKKAIAYLRRHDSRPLPHRS